MDSSLQRRLDVLITQRPTYRYLGENLADKTDVALIAPTAVGKSTLVTHILQCGNEREIAVAESGSITTRTGRPDDPPNYRTNVAAVDMINMIERGDLTNWSYSPTGHIYGGDYQSVPATYNFSPLIPDSLPILRRAGFRAVYAFYMTAPIEQWKRQLAMRVMSPTELTRRLEEAKTSLEYSYEQQAKLLFIQNPPGDAQLTKTANAILDIVTQDAKPVTDTLALQQRDDMYHFVMEQLHGNA